MRRMKSSVGMSSTLSGSLISDKNSLMSVGAATSTLNASRNSRRASIQLFRNAFVRTASCFLFKSKPDVENEYTYGSGASNESSPEIMLAKPELHTKRQVHCISVCFLRLRLACFMRVSVFLSRLCTAMGLFHLK